MTQLLNTREAAEYVGCTRKTVRRAAQKGLLHPISHGRGKCFTKDELDEWNAHRKRLPKLPPAKEPIPGLCTYGRSRDCSQPQAEHDSYNLHLCEKHTEQAHKILAKRPRVIRWPN